MTFHVPGRALALALCLPALLLGPSGLRSQVLDSAGVSGAMLSRADLTKLLHEYEMALQSPAYSGAMKREISSDAARVRDRLEHGDFQPGDRVVLSVQGQPTLPDTVPVEPGPKITLPVFGNISLAGVLRSEIAAHLTTELGKMIRNPVVRAHALMRLSVQGDVGKPGFYAVPGDILVSDAIMQAGGPSQTSDLKGVRIERGSTVIYKGQELQTAMREGRTLDQLNLEAGDEIIVPAQGKSIWGPILRYGLIVASTLILGVRVAGGF